ncbi:enoyl-CoA hydratase-related protein [Nocardioides sp. BP30]|uniref:enoyl-CoA hydratase/isomerase family protein n=1 Tax=Nocardioides sp. BP30 TaxID=3036374 RepID=UPI002468C024|nr:enoyl-CoA hydratase-related protein [Nocardioides sp. BP30]WGL54129.1 enoyl-CoA hydratase-related protein [Nocardioides sp. BP30]
MAEVLQVEVRDHVAHLTLNRPEAMNALNRELKRALIEAAHAASVDPEIWVVVLSGAGGRAFSVGGDLKEMGSRDDSGRAMTSPMSEAERNLYEVVLEIPKPTIAVVDGYALGGGFELALACDLRVCSDRARFGLPEATIGMGANFGSVLLPRLIPRAIALEMLYFARRMSGEELARLGLVNHVWPAEELDTRVAAWLAELTSKAPITLQRYKHMALKGWELPVAVNLRLDVGPNPYTSQDRIEGNRAFREKRAPRWRNR